jgi:hypothetical protein
MKKASGQIRIGINQIPSNIQKAETGIPATRIRSTPLLLGSEIK